MHSVALILYEPSTIRRKPGSHFDYALDMYHAYMYKKMHGLYDKMIDAGIAKECARDVLPIGSETTLYMNGTIRSWLHYIDLRASCETQLEHRTIAEGCKNLIHDAMPAVYEAMWC